MLEQEHNRLTIDGVLQLINKATYEGQSFLVQTLLISTGISDGFCQVQCQIQAEAKELVRQGKLKDYSVIRFTTNDCEVIPDDKNPCIILNKCQIIISDLNQAIGSPMHFKHYKENGFQNPDSTNLIQTGPHIYTIQEILNNTRIRNGHIKATVTNLPSNISKGFLIFNLKDPQGTQIQACCFEEANFTYARLLKLGQEYVFTGFVVSKNPKTNKQELKFRNQAQVFQIVKAGSIQTLKKLQQELQPELEPEPVRSNKPILEEFPHFTKTKLNQAMKEPNMQKMTFEIIGKVTFLCSRKNFRKINVQDANGETIDLVLWEEIKDKVEMNETYKFDNLRIKPKTDQKTKYLELHSTKKTIVTRIDMADFERIIEAVRPMPIGSNYQSLISSRSSYKSEFQRRQQTKQLPQNSKIISIQELIDISEQQGGEQNGVTVFPLVECQIKFRTEGLKFRDQADTMNYFSFFCKPCEKTGTVTLNDNDRISCNRCKRDDIQVKWNLRIRVMDFNSQLPCSLQNQATERLLNVFPLDGYLMLMHKKEEFQKMLHSVNFDTRVCKFQIKKHGMNTYFNILEVYAKESVQCMNRTMVGLRKTLEALGAKKEDEKENHRIRQNEMNPEMNSRIELEEQS